MTTEPSRARFEPGEIEGLMAGYQQSDEAAAATLVEKVSPPIFQFFLGQVRNRAQAEDLLQDFWLRIHSARHTYRSAEPALPWLYAIARRVQIDRYRKQRRIDSRELQVETLPETAGPQEKRDPQVDIQTLLAPLPKTQREVVLLLKVAGLSLEEVARATQSSVGSVKQKAHRAYEKLRAMLGADAAQRERGSGSAV